MAADTTDSPYSFLDDPANTMKHDCPFVDVVVIGLGVSSLPVLRRLDELQENDEAGKRLSFLCFTEKEFGIWGILNDSDEDFDILTSHCVSGFSWFPSTWNDGVEETDFPFVTAKAYYRQLQDSITPSLRRCIVHTKVTVIKEEKDGSGYTIYNDSGRAVARCRKVVETESRTLGYSESEYVNLLKKALTLRSKTVVLEGYSDTTNMLMARLMLGGNRVLITSRHFKNFDKCLSEPTRATENRLGWIGYEIVESGVFYSFFPEVYTASTSWANTCVSPYSRHPLSNYMRKKTGIDDYLIVEDFMAEGRDVSPSALLNHNEPPAGWGLIVKYWNAEAFFDHFGMYRELMRRNRMLLNDPYFFMKLGRVSVMHPSRIRWESESSIRVGTCHESIHVDWRVKSSKQMRSNEGVTLIDGDGNKYSPSYEKLLYGIWHPDHPNLYHVGKTRPVTGGYAHTGEAAGEFVIRHLIDMSFQNSIHRNFDTIAKDIKRKHYNRIDSNPGLSNAFTSCTTAHELQGLMGRHLSFMKAVKHGIFSVDMYLGGPTLSLRYQCDDTSLTPEQRHIASERYRDLCANHCDLKGYTIWFFCLFLWPYMFVFNFAVFLVSAFLVSDPVSTTLLLVLIIWCLAKTSLARGIHLSTFPYTEMAQHGNVDFMALVTLIILPCLIIYNSMCYIWPGQSCPGVFGTSVRSGVLPLFVTYSFAAFIQIQYSSVPFNDMRGKENYETSFEEYLLAVHSTNWYQKATGGTPRPCNPRQWEDITFGIREGEKHAQI